MPVTPNDVQDSAPCCACVRGGLAPLWLPAALEQLAAFTFAVSAAIAVLNMLPLAMLDGGQALQVPTHTQETIAVSAQGCALTPMRYWFEYCAPSWHDRTQKFSLTCDKTQAALAMNRWEVGPMEIAGLAITTCCTVRAWSVRVCAVLVVFVLVSHALRLVV